jgi:hypothetical protein
MNLYPFKVAQKEVSPVLQLDKLMLREKMPLPSYDFIEHKNNKWQVTCSIPSLNIEETISGGPRYEVPELVAEKVLGVVRDIGLLDKRKSHNG